MLKVAVFDEEHEKDLQHEINEFLKKLSEDQLVDISINENSSSFEELFFYVLYKINAEKQ